MSIKPWEKYQPYALLPSAQYPYGGLKQESTLGAGDGSPLDVDWGNDFEAFKQTAFSRSGIVPSGNADTVTNSEMFNAVQDIISRNLWSRLAAESGYNLVAGSFEEGGTITSPQDVLWSKKNNKIYSGPNGAVSPNTIPSGSFTNRSNILLRDYIQTNIKYITPEMFWLAGDVDDTNSWIRCIDYATTNGLDIEAHGRYTVSSNLLIKQVASTPAVSRDFTRITININYIKFTGIGACITNRSPAVLLRIGEMEGTTAFTVVDQTIGLQLSDNNQPLHQIGFIHGFATNIKFQDAYGVSVWIGHCDDALRGVRGDNSNACRIYGHVGGQFTTAAIDTTTCLVGVEWTSTCAANEVYAVVEYCRRNSSAKAFIDNGVSNKYYGYSESCHTASSIDGNYSEYDIFNGGDNVRSAAGYYAGGIGNHIKLLKANALSGATASATNIGLTFKYLQPMQSTTPQSSVSGPGLAETLGVGKTTQLVKYSNDLTNAVWNDSYSGGLTGATKAFGKYGAGETSRYIYGTQFTFANAASDETQFYRSSQTLTGITFAGHISLGIALRCVSGDVDVFVKLQGVTSGKVYTVEHRLTSGSKVMELWHSCPSAYGSPENYVFEIQLRPWAASVVNVYNSHACASPNVRRAPASIAGNITNFVQHVDEDSGINVRHSVAPSSIISYPLSLYQYDFDTYIMPNLTGNIILAGDGYDGQRVTFKKLGGAASNILSAKLIDGVTSYPMTVANSAVTLMFSAELDTWFVLSKN
ncbi:hypothetical protein BNCALIDO_00036 [Aeromonas phage vB_AdhM_TS9]|nr:hypothetical protein BNCALIDO_00036 [Aeromonas phage vB_AdhM_TS9]